jgi:hypothetical protein
MTEPDTKYKHKPSEKLTLEEVLKSLQDLIHNDLLHNSPVAPPAETSPQPAASRPPENLTPASSATPQLDLDDVARSLEDLVNNELNVDNRPSTNDASQARARGHDEAPGNTGDQLEPLDELLVFDESMEIVPPPVAAAHSPELPGDFFSGLLDDLETVPPPAAPEESPAALNENPSAQDSAHMADLAAPITSSETHAADNAAMELNSPDINSSDPATSAPAAETDLSASVPQEQPEIIPSTPAQKRAGKKNNAPGMQHELPFGDAPPLVIQTGLFSSPLLPDVALAKAPAAQTRASDLPDTASPTPDALASANRIALSADENKLPETDMHAARETQAVILSTLQASLDQDSAVQSSGHESATVMDLPDAPLASSPVPAACMAQEDLSDEKPIADESPDLRAAFSAPSSAPGQADDLVKLPQPITSPDFMETASREDMTTEKKPAPEPLAPVEINYGQAPVMETVSTGTTMPVTGGQPETPTRAESSAPREFDLKDVPVLEEIAVPAPTVSSLAGAKPAPVVKPALPSADRARDIVVRSVAKLNVEIRKSGGTVLDSKTIIRLQQLIRQEMEKDGEKS